MIGYLQILFKMFVLLGLIPQAPAPIRDGLTWLEARVARRMLAPVRYVVLLEDPQRWQERSARRVVWFPKFELYPRGAGWWGLTMNGEPLRLEGLYVPYRGRLLHLSDLMTYNPYRPREQGAFPYALEEFLRE